MTTEGRTPDTEWPHASWDDVVAAVAEASCDAEGLINAYYLEHHFQNAGLVVLYHVDMPEHPKALEEARNAALRVVADSTKALEYQAAENARLRKALEAAIGYLTNASIDLTTGAPKSTAIRTIEGGLKLVREALAKVGE